MKQYKRKTNLPRLTKKRSVFSTNNCLLFNPPNPIKQFFYRCDKKFHLNDLIKLYETDENYAIVLISGKRTEYYLYNANQTKFIKGFDESLPNQHKTGGQSAQRFGRIRDEKIGWYVKKIIEFMIKFYIIDNKFSYAGLIIAGPAEMKKLVREENLFIKYFHKNLLKTLTISEITSQSIYQVINLASDVLTSEATEKNLLFIFEQILTDPNKIDLIIFGIQETINAFKLGLLKEIYVADKNIHKQFIIKTETKTKIHIIKSSSFVSKYGELVGIKYYIEFNENKYDDVIEI